VVQRVLIVSCRIGWLSLTWAIRTFPVSLAASNVFLTVHGVGREDDAGQPEFADHLLRGGDFVALLVDLRMRQARAKTSSPAIAEDEAKAVKVCAALRSLM